MFHDREIVHFIGQWRIVLDMIFNFEPFEYNALYESNFIDSQTQSQTKTPKHSGRSQFFLLVALFLPANSSELQNEDTAKRNSIQRFLWRILNMHGKPLMRAILSFCQNHAHCGWRKSARPPSPREPRRRCHLSSHAAWTVRPSKGDLSKSPSMWWCSFDIFGGDCDHSSMLPLATVCQRFSRKLIGPRQNGRNNYVGFGQYVSTIIPKGIQNESAQKSINFGNAFS